jgi:hypothetical protein
MMQTYAYQQERPKWTPYGFPMYYLLHARAVLCPTCARAHPSTPVQPRVNVENPTLHCAHCAERIEPAFKEI